jgi:hypothetical protein
VEFKVESVWSEAHADLSLQKLISPLAPGPYCRDAIGCVSSGLALIAAVIDLEKGDGTPAQSEPWRWAAMAIEGFDFVHIVTKDDRW